MPQPIISYYEEQISIAGIQIEKFEKLVNTFSFLRLFSILLGGFLIFHSFKVQSVLFTELVFLGIVIGFAALVRQQGRYEKKKLYFKSLKQVNENEIASILNQTNIYDDGMTFGNDAHTYTSDLDIFGKSSLFNLVNRAATPLGVEKLAGWFIVAATEPEILLRQEAAKELATEINWNQHFKALLLFAKDSAMGEVVNLFNYFKLGETHLDSWIKVYVRWIPFVLLAASIAAWYIPMVLGLIVVLILFNFILVFKNQLAINKADRMLSKAGKTLHAYGDAFKEIEDKQWLSPLCKSLSAQINHSQSSRLSEEVEKLSVLLGRLEYRLNIFVGPVLNATMAWDVRQLIAIEKWREKNSKLIVEAFDVLASFESLVSLTTVHINYPQWCFPKIDSQSGYTYVATDLAHPLIHPDLRVSNNYSLINEHKIEIITGSNMAGKSTFLRTLGINAVLAFSGAPVCARTMEITVMNLFAYMRIRDSLNESISTFKAELNRLQLLLEVLKGDGKVFFLIDEMLRGTNSVDKYRGSKAVIEKLISKQAVGVVATHDLQIAQLEQKYPRYVRNYYFDIEVINGEMLFDYKLKHGECKTFNASLLLKQIDIHIDFDDMNSQN